ncbi:MotA/TolQ/ExbB proton channel family protein [bacterium]|nr:MotA/TolQ/ExbB proton channel family protein [bacterium]
MYFILIFAIATVGLIVERALALYSKVKEPAADFRQRVLAHLPKGEYLAAAEVARNATPATALNSIVETGCLLRANAAGEEELQARMDEKLAEEISKLDRRTGFLAMFGNVSTLLGLLGTISGMISSFAAVASANPAERATMLSAGISEAMNCTAFGLLTAIPALVAYAIFQNRTDRIVTQLTQTTAQIYHDLLFFTEGSAPQTAKQAATRPANAGLSAQPVGA